MKTLAAYTALSVMILVVFLIRLLYWCIGESVKVIHVDGEQFWPFEEMVYENRRLTPKEVKFPYFF